VSVGVVLLAADTKPAPRGVADSKLLSPQARLKLVPRIRRWALDCAVGHASAAEIDAVGLMAALRIAAGRAVGTLAARPDWILLDGNYDYLSHGAALAVTDDSQHGPAPVWSCTVPVVTVVNGDRTCASIAAASVLAKAERDAMLVELAREHPHYGFEVNKAYATPLHLQALRRHGPSAVHRCSWNLPVSVAPGAPMGDDEQMSIAGVGL
jgi:ribonuclease HII